MAKRNINTKKHQNDIAAIKKNSSAVFRFAYILYTGPRGTGAKKAVKQLLTLRNKELPGETLPHGTGAISEYRKLMLDAGGNFDSLALVLLKATEDERLKERVLEILLSRFGEDVIQFLNESVARKNNSIRIPLALPTGSDDYRAVLDRFMKDGIANSLNINRTHHQLHIKLTASWAGIYEYVDLLCAWDTDFINDFPHGKALKTSAREIAGFISGDFENDKDRVIAYNNKSPFYRLFMDVSVKTFTAFSAAGARSYDSRLEFDSAFNILENIYENTQKNISEYKRQTGDVLVVLPEKNATESDDSSVPFDKDMEFIRIWLGSFLSTLRMEYLISGIDIFSAASLYDLPVKECRNIVKKAFLYYDIRYFSEKRTNDACDYEKESDRIAVMEMTARFWADSIISSRLDLLLDENRLDRNRKEKTELSQARRLIRSLRDEVEDLRGRQQEAGSKDLSEIKEKNALIKELRSELHKTEKKLTGAVAQIAALEDENRDLRAMVDSVLQDENEDADENASARTGITEDYFKEYIRTHKVLVWGLRPSTEQKYTELYPELSFADSNRKLTARQLEGCDTFIMCTSNTCHGNYWAARDTVKRSGIRMAYLAKTMNDPMYLWQALDVALNGNGRDK